ncbi:mycoredoxin [uncultured Brevibacterium sp.]|mgnify:FL=1|uniref:mycoredoxin n=1 Tax=uncultured Brevibacterium sp. TaxID=189678 RepID=UPI0025F26B93|nr:mycoredoxin [uncultured Brevibacterium sp.]
MSEVTTPETTGPLTLFTTTWCPFCTRLKKLLDEKEIGYAEIDVESDAEAAAFVESVNDGNRVVPTALYSDGTTATNPPASQVRAKLTELAGA